MCGLKPATEHCDERDGWFEMMKGVIDSSTSFKVRCVLSVVDLMHLQGEAFIYVAGRLAYQDNSCNNLLSIIKLHKVLEV